MPIPSSSRPGRLLVATDGRDILENSPDGWEIDQPWLWWDGPAGGDGTGGPWGNPPPGADSMFAGGGTLPAMARCRALIADTLAGVPFQVFRGREQLPTPTWIVDPQGLQSDARMISSVSEVALSSVEFWSSVIVSAVELGEGIVYSPALDPNGAYDPTRRFGTSSSQLWVINPRDVTVDAYRYYVNGELVGPNELLVIRNRVWPGKFRGHGVWDQFRSEIGLGSAIRDYASNMLGRGIPAGYLKVTAPDLAQDEADRLKDKWMTAHGGRDRRIAVLNATTDFHPLQLDPQALQLAELLRMSAWEIALIYGIPPYKLGISMGSNNTYANVESQSIDYVQDSLLPWARRIEAAIDAAFPWGTNLKLDLDGLRRADTKTRYESYAIALTNGWMTVDEVRTLEDLPPMDDVQARRALDYATALRRMEVS
jgi:HK97 family phage portal protein